MEYSMSPEQRAEKYMQKSALISLLGKGFGQETDCQTMESELFSEGRLVYFLGIGNVLYGVDPTSRVGITRGRNISEDWRRCHILLDSGMILIVTAIDLTREDLELIQTTIHSDKIETSGRRQGDDGYPYD